MPEPARGLILAGPLDGVPDVRVGGLDLSLRAAILFSRAGIGTIHSAASEESRERIAEDPRVRSIVTPGVSAVAGAIVACDAASVFDAAAVGRLLAAPGDDVLVVRDAARRPVLARLPAAGAELAETLQAADGDLEGLVSRAERRHACREVGAAAGVALRVTQPEEAALAERRLVAAAGNVRDGCVDRLLNRRLSRPLTLLLARTGLAPNHVSVLSILLGLAGAALVACRGYAAPLAGLLVIQAASVLDCCDGELARLRLRESVAGHWLDIVGDTITHAALFVAIGVVVWREGLASAPTLAWLLVGGILPTFACVTYAEQTTGLRARAGGRLNDRIDGLVHALTTRDYLVLVLAFAVAGRLAWFLAGAAIGVHVFWLILLALLVAERRQRESVGRAST